MVPGQQASAEGMAVEGAEDEGEADLAATNSMEAAGVADTAVTTRATDAVAADSTASATIVTRADICGAIATSSLMDGLLLKAKRVEEQKEGEEEAVEAVVVAEVVLQLWGRSPLSMTPRADLLAELEPSPVKHVTSALGQRAEVKGMGKAMFKGADGKMVGLKNVLQVPILSVNLISVRRLQKAGMDTSSKGAKTYTSTLGERILWDLHDDRDVYNEMWQIPVVPMPKEGQVAASMSTKGEAVGSGNGANNRPKEIKSKKCNLGGTSKLGEQEESGAASKNSEAMAKAPLDEVVMDVVGPLKLGSAGSKYFLTIVDVYTRMTWVYAPSKKSDVAETVKTDWFPMVERQQNRKGKRRIQAPNWLTYEALGNPAKSALAGAALIVGNDVESEYEECAFAFFSPVEMPGEPATLKEALEGSDAEEWKKAIESELKSIEENGTWELVELPEGRKAMTSKWLFKIKSDADGKIERYKSRLVAKGYQQKEKVDNKELFAPVWYLKLRGILEEIGFTPSMADDSLFMLGEGEQRSFMVVYVEDILIFSPSSNLVHEVMLKLQDKFKYKALGDVSFCLGLHIEGDVEKRCMRVHQRKYLEALAANFGQSEGHVATPFPSKLKCVKGTEEESVGEEERRRFHSLVGSLMYAAENVM
ncbi:unnamed protein product [Closterium sp. NIES-53]